MTVLDIQREIEQLPALLTGATTSGGDGETVAPPLSPLQVAAKQGRLLLRLSASSEALEARLRDLTNQAQERDDLLREAQEAAKASRDEARRESATKREAEADARKLALEAVRLMDALEAAQAAAVAQGESDLGREIGVALQSGARRLAAVGVTEVPASGLMDGRLHSGVDTAPRNREASETPREAGIENAATQEEHAPPQYHIVRVVRRGWQRGADVLRRADVVTTE